MTLSLVDLFPEGSLPEKRLRERAIKISEASTERPGAAMTEAFDDWRDTRAAYRFFENKKMSLAVLLDSALGVVGRTLRELAEGMTVLNVQDTTEINLSHLNTMRGLGEIGNPKNRGLFLHPSIAMNTEGVPIGLLSAQTWARPIQKKRTTRASRKNARRAKSFEDKESVRWWNAIEQSEQRVDRAGLLLHVGDRESDIYELFAQAKDAGYRVLTRAARDRSVEGDQAMLWAQVASFSPSKEQRHVSVPERSAKDGKPARAARETSVVIRYGAVTLRAPHRAKGSIEMWAIEVTEVDPPDGVEPLEWLLLTSDPITSFAEAWLRVDWYRRRWRIEEFFKLLKSGCRIEARQFESRETFEVALGISLLTAVGILALTIQARIEPDAPAANALSPEQEQVLIEHAQIHRGRAPESPPLTLAQAVVFIAMLGGYKARSCDGPPGWLTIWRGWRRLETLIDGYRLARPTSRHPGSKRKEGGKIWPLNRICG